MEFIADGLLIAGAATAAFYCWILSVRVKGLKDLDTGLGAAIAALSEQVDEMQSTLKGTRSSALEAQTKLSALTERAEIVAENLSELMDAPERPAPKKKARRDKVEKLHFKTARQEDSEDEDEAFVAEDIRERPAKLTEVPQSSKPMKAQKLQDDVSRRLRSGGSEERDELVRTLQSILAANE